MYRYATMRHVLRDLRVGANDGEPMTDEECVTEDPSGKPPLPALLREVRLYKLKSVNP